MERKIYSVDGIVLTIYNSKRPQLLISAAGTVTTIGWRSPRLKEYVYIDFPADGYWEFDFIADEPSSVVPEVLTPVAAAHLWDGDLSRLKGVRIYAAANKMERDLIGTAEIDQPNRVNPKFPETE